MSIRSLQDIYLSIRTRYCAYFYRTLPTKKSRWPEPRSNCTKCPHKNIFPNHHHSLAHPPTPPTSYRIPPYSHSHFYDPGKRPWAAYRNQPNKGSRSHPVTDLNPQPIFPLSPSCSKCLANPIILSLIPNDRGAPRTKIYGRDNLSRKSAERGGVTSLKGLVFSSGGAGGTIRYLSNNHSHKVVTILWYFHRSNPKFAKTTPTVMVPLGALLQLPVVSLHPQHS